MNLFYLFSYSMFKRTLKDYLLAENVKGLVFGGEVITRLSQVCWRQHRYVVDTTTKRGKLYIVIKNDDSL